jgi:hypothetical protein
MKTSLAMATLQLLVCRLEQSHSISMQWYKGG